MIALLLTGYMHNIMSRLQYAKVRVLVGLLGPEVHHWSSIWRVKARLRAMLNMEPVKRESVFKNKCYALRLEKTIALVCLNTLMAN
jgi:hypothetical protein